MHPLIENLFRRIERMTGLKTKYAEKLHVLNYGVGGQYELHLDFFDFANVSKFIAITFWYVLSYFCQPSICFLWLD